MCRKPSIASVPQFRIFGLLLVLGLWAGGWTGVASAQPEFLGEETVLLEDPDLSSTVASLAIDDGFLVATGRRLSGEVELQVLKLDDDGVPMATVGSVPSSAPFEAFLLDDGAGGALLVWREFLLSSPYRMAVRHFPADGEPGEVFELTQEPWVAGFAEVVPLASGQFLAVWRTQVPSNEDEPQTVQGRRFGPEGPVGPPFLLAGVESHLQSLEVIPGADGGFLVVWSIPGPFNGTTLKARRWKNGIAQPVVSIETLPFGVGTQPVGVPRRNSGFQLVWRGIDGQGHQKLQTVRLDGQGRPLGDPVPLVGPGPMIEFGRADVARNPIGRFWVVWPEDAPGTGDLMAQILDGDGLPQGAPFQVNQLVGSAESSPRVAIGRDGRALVTWIHDSTQLTGRVLSEFPEGACEPSPSTLCLGEGRFQVEVAWQSFDGATGVGRDTGFATSESGLLWFFGPNNWELLVKVIDGCANNGHFWVYAAATTDVAYDLRVTDTLTGDTRTYSNPLGQASPTVNDTSAFSACDKGPR